MLLNDAIKIRIKNLMKEKGIRSNYELTCKAGLNPSSLNDFFRKRISYPKIDTLFLICESLELSLETFFSDPIFNSENIQVEKDLQ